MFLLSLLNRFAVCLTLNDEPYSRFGSWLLVYDDDDAEINFNGHIEV